MNIIITRTAEEIMRDHDATPQEVCDHVDHFYCSYGQNGDVDTFVFKNFGRFKQKAEQSLDDVDSPP